MHSAAKLIEQSLSYWYLSGIEWFCLRPNISNLSTSEQAYPHSNMMQEPKDKRKKDIEPGIYRGVKVTNTG
jgi:hypothetical protein